MDKLFFEIKNFLKKLETGHHNLQQAQWDLYNDIAILKKTLEEYKCVKNDVENLKKHIILIKELDVKVECLKQQLEALKNSSNKWNATQKDKQSSSWGTSYSLSNSEDSASCSYLEIKERRNGVCEESEEESFFGENSGSSEINASTCSTWTPVLNKKRKKRKIRSCEKKYLCSHHNANSSLMHRYLKDTDKYINQRSCSEKNKIKNYKDCNFNMSSMQHSGKCRKPLSSYSSSSVQTVIPKRLVCPTCPKKYMCEANHGRLKHFQMTSLNSCNLCKKNFKTKDLLKAHKATHRKSKRTNSYTCGYCKRGCKTLENFTRHLRNCRNILRSHFSKHEL